MARPPGLGHLSKDEWEQLQDRLDRFEAAWEKGDEVELADFLPPDGDPLRLVTLHELIKTELEFRWRRGQVMRLENYLQRYPELGSSQALPVELICEEYRVRQQHGDKPELEAYQARFPKQFAKVEQLARAQGIIADPSQATKAVSVKPQASVAAAPPLQAAQDVVLPVGGGYKLIKRLGSGTFGEVWRAEAPGGVEVAVKLIFRALGDAESQRELDSLELIKRLRHPYLLQTQAFFSFQDRLLIVMELADGSLRDRLKECRQKGLKGIPLSELIVCFREAAEAIDFLHEKKVLHRDIKPDNILLLEKHAKLADFGLARMLESKSFAATGSGTPSYMAPEVWRNRGHENSDQYSLAATYAELRLNRRLFESRDMMQLMLDHFEQTPDMSPLNDAEQRALHKALAKDPHKRHGSCTEFIEELSAAVAVELGVVRVPVGTAMGGQLPGTPTGAGTFNPNSTVGAGELGTANTPTGGQAGTVPHQAATAGLSAPNWRTIVEAPAGPAPTVTRRGLLAALVGLPLAGAGAAAAWYFFFRDEPELPTEKEVDFLPKGCQKEANAKVVTVGGKKLYDRIAYVLEDGTRIPFILIRKKEEGDPDTFYIMENKVSAGLFRKFVAAHPEVVKDTTWKDMYEPSEGKPKVNTDANLPVFYVTPLQSHRFAEWLCGRLPRELQWEKAAGARDGAARPYEGGPDWQPGELAMNRAVEGPMPVGSATRDRTIFGCRDMTGNGREWTRDANRELSLTLLSVPVDGDTTKVEVVMRGHGYTVPKPKPGFGSPESEPYDTAKQDISFRVVIELTIFGS